MTSPRDLTIAAYEADAAAYAAGMTGPGEHAVLDLDSFSERLGPDASVLEIGSGAGLDALELERRGQRVRRTDITPAFVELLRRDGHQADVLDPLVDDLGGPYDAVWASAVLLHLAREEMAAVLTRMAAATRPAGLLHVSLKEGDGEAWSTHGHVAGARHFTFWREEALRSHLDAAGWQVEALRHQEHPSGPWLYVRAVRR